MHDYRLLAAVAAGLIALAGVLSVTAGGAPPVPPPVALRGPSSVDTTTVVTDGLEFVPPTVAELVPPTTTGGSPEPVSLDSPEPALASADSPDDTIRSSEEFPDSAPTTVDSTEVASADSPDEAGSEAVVVPAADSPDVPDSPESADSLDSADSPDG